MLHYQPLVDLRTGEVTGAEALVRLRRSDGSTLSPGEFIPHAEASGLVVPMGEQVLKRVTTDVLEWRGRGQARQVALNVSPTQLRQPGFADSLLHRAEDIGIAPTLLAVEVTEHALIRDPMGSARELQALHDAGVTIALDDFGTGYSSLAWLTDYPVDLLKIDRSFTDEMTHNARKAAVVRAVIDVAHDIGIRVVAEGIETDAQRRMLVELDCDLGQGYLFSRPLPADDPYWAAPPSSSSTTATGHR